ncbi:MAG: PIN domain-containing protein [Candidatus Woesearchaeota archaeon]
MININEKAPKLKKKKFKELIEDSKYITINEFIKKNTSKEVLVFDTNFLFVPFEFRVEIISEIIKILGNDVSFVILRETLDELERIEQKKTKNKKFLPLIATLLKKYNVSILISQEKIKKSSFYVDAILHTLPKNWVIATNDKELKQSLWKIPRRVIFMRQKSYLDIK